MDLGAIATAVAATLLGRHHLGRQVRAWSHFATVIFTQILGVTLLLILNVHATRFNVQILRPENRDPPFEYGLGIFQKLFDEIWQELEPSLSYDTHDERRSELARTIVLAHRRGSLPEHIKAEVLSEAPCRTFKQIKLVRA